MKLGLAIMAVVLFVGNYQICELFYENDLVKWWGLKQNIYNVIIAISFYLSTVKHDEKDRWYNFIINVGVGLCISNCIDRIFFDINYFTYADVLMIIITLATSYYKRFKKIGTTI